MIRAIQGVFSAAALAAAAIGLFPGAVAAPAAAAPGPAAPVEAAGFPPIRPPSGLDRDVLALALDAARCASGRGVVAAPGTLTVIDYSRPSTEKRLWVIDLESGRPLYREFVAHGQGTGDNLASRFSNRPNSHQSSLGLFVAAEPYVGQNGYSLRLDGLEPGVNDRARERAIVIHGAPYVDPALASVRGRLGRSWGCPALRPAVARAIIDRIAGGGLVFAYYPDPRWLETSRFLGCGDGSSRS